MFIFGFGYTAEHIAELMPCAGTKRGALDVPPIYAFDGAHRMSAAGEKALAEATAVLVSVPPTEKGCPVFTFYSGILARKDNLKWFGYFSSTGVYGDHNGAWIDENAPLNPQGANGKNRLLAEEQWRGTNLPYHVFRLSGIYGPGRNAVNRARENAPIIEKQNHVMNRIHVMDVARLIAVSVAHPTLQQVFNVADDEPASSAEVLRYAYTLLGKTPPNPIPDTDPSISSEMRGYYASNKRIRNDKIKALPGFSLQFPDYRAGLEKIS